MNEVLKSPIDLTEIHKSFDAFSISQIHELRQIVIDRDISSLYSFTWDACLMVQFDWPQWEQGGDFYGLEEWDFGDKDLVFCYKFLTAIIRNGRFVDNAVENLLEKGNLVGLVDRLIEFKDVKA
jgi:hypothetical protein